MKNSDCVLTVRGQSFDLLTQLMIVQKLVLGQIICLVTCKVKIAIGQGFRLFMISDEEAEHDSFVSYGY